MNELMKYLISFIIGLLLYVFLNYKDSFYIGYPWVFMTGQTATGVGNTPPWDWPDQAVEYSILNSNKDTSNTWEPHSFNNQVQLQYIFSEDQISYNDDNVYDPEIITIGVPKNINAIDAEKGFSLNGVALSSEPIIVGGRDNPVEEITINVYSEKFNLRSEYQDTGNANSDDDTGNANSDEEPDNLEDLDLDLDLDLDGIDSLAENDCDLLGLPASVQLHFDTFFMKNIFDALKTSVYKLIVTDFESIINLYALILYCKTKVGKYSNIPYPILVTNPHASIIESSPPPPIIHGINRHMKVHNVNSHGECTEVFDNAVWDELLTEEEGDSWTHIHKVPFESDAIKWNPPIHDFNIEYTDTATHYITIIMDGGDGTYYSYGCVPEVNRQYNNPKYLEMLNLMRQFGLTTINELNKEKTLVLMGYYGLYDESDPSDNYNRPAILGLSGDRLYNYFTHKISKLPFYNVPSNNIPLQLYCIACTKSGIEVLESIAQKRGLSISDGTNSDCDDLLDKACKKSKKDDTGEEEWEGFGGFSDFSEAFDSSLASGLQRMRHGLDFLPSQTCGTISTKATTQMLALCALTMGSR